MESAINKVVLSGCAGADAEFKTLPGNQKLAKVNLAVNEFYKNSAGEDVKKTHWFNLIFWNAKAELAVAQIKKGTRITVEGRLNTGSYEAKDGSKRFTTEIIVTDLVIKEIELSN
ncbi:single-stranded DNA-binding protein [Pedobacter chinensis]|uniref:Single-stranded DNA-binding protein n=1 Tax=Pedobacter chinensis TaxID=2282421 RepID=A0A369PUY9_9SPHI|nr:single-stranded DNA-binding protein [Pedobacter chinensis]RDC56334.1 single-stranded DNA-binding protein [Pedobacter chinensis]